MNCFYMSLQTTLKAQFQIKPKKEKDPQYSSNISQDLIHHHPENTRKKSITYIHPTVNHAGSSLADKISHLFLLTINLVHQLKSLAVMRVAVKQDPAGRNSKAKELERQRDRERDSKEREREETRALLCSVSDQLDMCDLCLLHVSIGNPTHQH